MRKMSNLERIIEFHPAFDKRDPDPSKNYSIHGVECLFLLRGKKGAVQFLLFTNWHLPHIQKEFDAEPLNQFLYMFHKPVPVDLGYHSPKPIYEGQIAYKDCKWLDGKLCYYDGSSLNAERVYEILLTEGSEGVWKYLEEYYKSIFGELV